MLKIIFQMRFLNCQTGGKIPSRSSILEVGVEKAIIEAGFDEKMFKLRGGVYNWTKNNQFDW
jgi:radical S-adenosyl methionine domain-containing protein 2